MTNGLPAEGRPALTDRGSCPKCGGPLDYGACQACSNERGFRVVRREMAILILVSVAAVPAYLLTRAVAAWNRQTDVRIAGEWYRRGQGQLRAGETIAATESLRRASVRDRDNPKIALALAQVLAAKNRDAEARTALLRLSGTSPNDPEIHLELARLSARGGDVPDALLHYHEALNGPLAGKAAAGVSRPIRMELVRFLLDHHESGRALAELLVLAADTPPSAESHVEVARLFLEAGDTSRALEEFVEACRLDRQSPAALAGAGEASFRLGDYRAARRYLEQAVDQDPGDSRSAELLETTRLIQTANPLAPRLASDERVTRLLAGLDQSAKRLDACLEPGSDVPASEVSGLEQLRAEVVSMRGLLEAKGRPRGPGLVQDGAELVFRVEEASSRACGEPTGLDLALLLIGRRHGGAGS